MLNKRNKEVKEKYYFVKLKGAGVLSIHEEKNLSEDEYHPAEEIETGSYQKLVVEKGETGSAVYNLLVTPEEYSAFRFKTIKFQKANNATLDGFSYDKEHGIVVYGVIDGIYATMENGKCYDVVSGEVIPWSIISYYVERETVEQLEDMRHDLETIHGHEDVYIQLMRDQFKLLEAGEENLRIATKKYEEKYEQAIKQLEEERNKKQQRYKVILRRQKPMILSEKLKIKQLIDTIRSSK